MFTKSVSLASGGKLFALCALGALLASLALATSASASKPRGSVLIPPEINQLTGSPCWGHFYAEAIYQREFTYKIDHGIQGTCVPYNQNVIIYVTWCRSHITDPLRPERGELDDVPNDQRGKALDSCFAGRLTPWETSTLATLSHGSEIEFTIKNSSYAWAPPADPNSWCKIYTPQIAGCGVGRWFQPDALDDFASFG